MKTINLDSSLRVLALFGEESMKGKNKVLSELSDEQAKEIFKLRQENVWKFNRGFLNTLFDTKEEFEDYSTNYFGYNK